MLVAGGAQVISSRHTWESQAIPFGSQAPASHSAQLSMPAVQEVAAQCVPRVLLPPSTQTLTPVAHDVVPFLQMLGLVVHVRSAVQATQLPALLQTMLVPQLAPSAFGSLLLQTIVPLLQLVMPVKQGSGLVAQL